MPSNLIDSNTGNVVKISNTNPFVTILTFRIDMVSF